jgi:cell pole-organizing protein PopZ
MSKPDPTATKSLEEILASIRKSLADEPSPRQPELPAAPAQTSQPDPKPASSVASDPLKANGAEVLAGKLAAGLLNGVTRSQASDDDLSDLLASAPKKPAPAAPVDAPKPGEAKSNARDPLWFLTRLSAAAADAVAPGPAARARDAAKAPTPPVEDVKLSRPETLRPSLPPLFGAGSDPIPPAAARPDIQDTGPTARTEPRNFPTQVNGEARAAQAEPEVAVTTPAPTPVVQAAPPTPPPAIPVAADTLPKEPPQATSAPETAPTVAVVIPQQPAEVEPSPPVAQVQADPAAEPPRPTADSAPAPGPEPVGAAPTRGFEQAVGELLEPVIRQWLQSNLPRMIEKAVREEVVRALAAERDAAKR